MSRIYRSTALGIALVLSSTLTLAAEWKELGHGDGFTTSADLSSVRRNGDVAELWTLWNYDKPQVLDKSKFLSMKEDVLYNCADHSTAAVAYVLYSDRDGGGKVTFQRTMPAVFVTALEGSASDGVRKLACAIRATPRPQ